MTDKNIMVDQVIPFAILAYVSFFSFCKIEDNAGTILALWWLGAGSVSTVAAFVVLLVPRDG